MVPNLTPIVITLGVMGWFGDPARRLHPADREHRASGWPWTTPSTSCTTSGATTSETGDVPEAPCARPSATTGQALLFTSLCAVHGFLFIYMLASHELLLTGFTSSRLSGS